ncbi:MAG TPA: M1 family aminopeptidase [Thermoanaerobaculia bacterium]|nr:M1 family aminopeptidase [Thermoanaerobaculia bacterium]
MLRDLIAFEWRYHTRQIAFLAGALLFLFMGFALPATSFGPDNVAINSPLLVMQSLAFLSLISVFVAAVFTSNAVLRDPEHRMQEIVYSTPVGRFHFLAGRFLGAFLATATAVAFSMLGMVIGTFMPWLDPERIAPFDAMRYLWAFGVLSVPNVLFATVLLLAIAVLTRNALATYAGAVFIYILYFIVAAMTNSPLMAASRPGAAPGALAALLDPFGLTAFFDVTRYWTAAAKSTRVVPLEGMLLWNRVIWVGGAVAVGAVVYRVFSFRVRAGKVKKEKKESPSSGLRPPSPRKRGEGTVGITPSAFASFWSAARIELRVLRSVPVLLLLFLWVCLATSEIYADIASAEYGARLIPATSLIVERLRAPISIIGTMLLIYYGAEMFWREQRHRMAAIIDTTPVPGAVMIAAKGTAMAALIATVIATGILPGIALQIARGYWHFEPLVYLSLFWFSGFPLLLFGAVALLVHTLSPGKYAGMMLVLLVAIFTRVAPRIGLDHPVWQFANAPPVRYSDMNGFGHDPVAFHWAVLHWNTLAVLFVMIAAAAWRRIGHPLKERFRAVRLAHVIAVGVLAVITGGWLAYKMPAESVDEQNAWRADYEKTYKRLESLPQPRITAFTTNIDLYPEQRRYRVAGHYDVVNVTRAPIRSVMVSVRRDARNVAVSMPAATPVKDQRFNIVRFDFARPLEPGARTKVHFDLSYEDPDDDTIAANGSFLMTHRIFPGIGYRASYELRDVRERRKRGLAGSGELPLSEEGPEDATATERVHFQLTISTSRGQTAIAPGHLARAWEHNGRRYFAYKSDAPIFNRFAIASARYEVARRRHRGVDVELYYHPAHRANVERTLDIAVAALDYCETNFGRYATRQLRMAEVPSYWPFGAFAMPETMFLVETRTLLIDGSDPDRIDLLGRRIAHEAAHQWWGHILAPADGEGATMIVESLTKYTDMMVLERMRGRGEVLRLREYELDRYLAGRSAETDAEPPLYKATRQSYIYYSKGALALYAIRERIGEERLNRALRDLLAEYRDRGGRATTHDLLKHLHRVAGPENARLIDEWMKEIVLYDFTIASAEAKQRADGRYDVTIGIEASKRYADGQGNEKPVAFREPVEIGAYTRESETPVHLASPVLHEGRNVVTFTLARPPAYVSVDPNLLHIDTKRADNEKDVQ